MEMWSPNECPQPGCLNPTAYRVTYPGARRQHVSICPTHLPDLVDEALNLMDTGSLLVELIPGPRDHWTEDHARRAARSELLRGFFRLGERSRRPNG